MLEAFYAPFEQLQEHLENENVACEVEPAPPKHLYRVLEKSAFREDDPGNADFVKDIVRGKAQSAEMAVLNMAPQFIIAKHHAARSARGDAVCPAILISPLPSPPFAPLLCPPPRVCCASCGPRTASRPPRAAGGPTAC